MMFIASTAMKLYSSNKESKAREKQAKHQQALLNMKANEFSRRSKENLQLFQEQATKQIGQEKRKFSSRYGEVGEVTQNQFVSQSYSSMFEEMRRQKRRDDWDVEQVRSGAAAAGENAKDISRARYWDNLSMGVEAGMQAKQAKIW